jgi:uroporphyrinogen-III synthase
MVHAGFCVEHWPLIQIEPASFGDALEEAIGQWTRWRAVFFVSPQAVLYFFQHARGALDLRQTRCWATGAGTREALLGQGVAADLIDTPNLNSGIWDSEHLWLEVQDQVRVHDQVLIVRGGELSGASLPQEAEGDSAREQGAKHEDRTGVGREYLAEQVRSQGAQVSWAVAYFRGVPQWSSAQVALARQALCDGSVWILTSSQAVRNLQDLLGNEVASWSQGRAIATHHRIAQALNRAGFGVVRESRPNIESLLGSLESMQ